MHVSNNWELALAKNLTQNFARVAELEVRVAKKSFLTRRTRIEHVHPQCADESRSLDTERLLLDEKKKDKRSLVLPREGIVHLPKFLTDRPRTVLLFLATWLVPTRTL